ncbi:hypothetical protein VNO80_02668 [Phaseolus coccineus]|uniref:Uncharacterized protein n=1 Tax=Phaseolus coccineus TaxID=3886 RepID=A0AAN9NQP3_PHACN
MSLMSRINGKRSNKDSTLMYAGTVGGNASILRRASDVPLRDSVVSHLVSSLTLLKLLATLFSCRLCLSDPHVQRIL